MRLAYNAAGGGVLQVWLGASLEIGTTHAAAGTAVNQIQVLAAAALYNYDDFYLTDTATQPPLGQIVRIGANGPGYRSDFDTLVPPGINLAEHREENVDEIPPNDTEYNEHKASTVATDSMRWRARPRGRSTPSRACGGCAGGRATRARTHDYAWRVQGVEGSQAFTFPRTYWTQSGGRLEHAPEGRRDLDAGRGRRPGTGSKHNGTFRPGNLDISWTAAMVDYDSSGTEGAPTCTMAAHKPWYNASLAYRKAIRVDHTKWSGTSSTSPCSSPAAPTLT